ncbi:MAG: hypothetical protein RL648_507 [Verrucomicrobiota bacterium]
MIVLAELTHWVHDLDPVLWQITETLAIRWYGLAYLAGFLTAFGLLYLYWRRGFSPLAPPAMESVAMAMILGVILGGRLGYFLLYTPRLLIEDPLIFFKVWEGGMASHGGFAGVALATVWAARRQAVPVLQLGDLVCSVAAGGLFFGRLANFVNGELWGKVTSVPWAVIFPGSAPPGTPLEAIFPRHPSQLYQAGLEGLCLLLYMQGRFWWTRLRGRPLPNGQLSGEFFLFYAVARIIVEYFREPDAGLLFGLSRGAFYSIFIAVVGAALVIVSRRR